MTSRTIGLQPGPQILAAESKAQIIFYGGAKGGGKSFWGAMECAKYYDTPGRGALMFRRTYPELKGEGSLWEETSKLYPLLGGEPIESKMMWKFPSTATVSLRHLQHEKDADKYNGKNIGDVFFDELPHFTERQFWQIRSCQRSMAKGAAPKIRASMNPDPDSWVLQFVKWYIDDAGFPVPERSGVVRWFGRIDGKLRWFDTEADAHGAGVDMPTSFTFIAARIWDNPALMNARPEYLANLKSLPPVEQARFLGGNWKIRAAAGDYFQEPWFPHIPRTALERKTLGFPDPAKDVVAKVRAWDFAATPVEGDTVVGAPQDVRAQPARDDADWTRGILFGILRDGRAIILDVQSCRDAPGAVEYLVRRTAERDGHSTVIALWGDPAQAGVHQLTMYARILRGFRVAYLKPFDPLDVASIASRMVMRKEILVPMAASWLPEFMRELEAFPNEKVHDDQVSALGLGCVWMLENAVQTTKGARRPHFDDFGDRDPFEMKAPASEGTGRVRVRNDVRISLKFKYF